jgi:hypothetical protein
MSEDDKILIAILAQTDAVFRPARRDDWVAPAPCNLYNARQRFSTAGVPFDTGGGDETGRKNQQRDLNRLAKSGLLILCGGKRREGVKLTEPAEIGLRALCGLPSLRDSHAMLRKIIKLAAMAEGMTLTREIWLAGFEDYHNTSACKAAPWKISLALAPALCRGFVESRSDCFGRCCYVATDKGREAAKLPAPSLPAGLPRYQDIANKLYYEATIAARQKLRTATPTSPSEIGQCPLSASLNLQKPRPRKART